jgi:hypothetical protein
MTENIIINQSTTPTTARGDWTMISITVMPKLLAKESLLLTVDKSWF